MAGFLFDVQLMSRVDRSPVVELVDVQQSLEAHVVPFRNDERAVAGLYQIGRFGDHFVSCRLLFLTGRYQQHLANTQLVRFEPVEILDSFCRGPVSLGNDPERIPLAHLVVQRFA